MFLLCSFLCSWGLLKLVQTLFSCRLIDLSVSLAVGSNHRSLVDQLNKNGKGKYISANAVGRPSCA